MLKEKYYDILEKKYNINDNHRDKIEKFIKNIMKKIKK